VGRGTTRLLLLHGWTRGSAWKEDPVGAVCLGVLQARALACVCVCVSAGNGQTKGMCMAGTRATPVVANYAKCTPNAPLLGAWGDGSLRSKNHPFKCLAGLGAFLLAYIFVRGERGTLGFHVPFSPSEFSS
jgi:hypothetical protein